MSRVEIESEVTGNVWKIETKVGDHVEPEDVLLILESMKNNDWTEIGQNLDKLGDILKILNE